MKKGRKKRGLTALVCLVVIAVVLTCTPGMALRTSAFMCDMGSAFTMEFEKVIAFLILLNIMGKDNIYILVPQEYNRRNLK